MSRTFVVVRLAVRELWMSFRLLAVLAAYVAAGAFVALLPTGSSAALARLAAGLAGAVVLGGAVAAASFAAGRVSGRSAWLVSRSVSRATLLAGWFLALSGVSLLGLAAAATLGWLAVAAALPPFDVPTLLAVFVAVAAAAVASLGIGLLAGSLLPPGHAAVAAVAGSVLVGAVTWYLGQPFMALATLAELDRPLTAGLRGAGIALAVAGASLLLARAALERADL